MYLRMETAQIFEPGDPMEKNTKDQSPLKIGGRAVRRPGMGEPQIGRISITLGYLWDRR